MADQSRRRKALKLVAEAPAPKPLPGIDRAARARRRARISSLTRPAPGTSDLLRVPFSLEKLHWGARDVEVYDLTELAPLHLPRRKP